MARHKPQIISNCFVENNNEFTVLKSPPQSPDPNPIEHLWDVAEHEIPIMDVQPTCAGNVEMLSYLYGSKSLNLLLNVCHKELS